jgi:transposase
VLLARAQRDEVLVMLGTTTPNDHGYTNSLIWSTRILATGIEQKYSVICSSRTSYYVLLKKSGFSFHLPDKRFEKADAEVVAA